MPFCLGSGSGSGSQIFYPLFRFRFLPSNFNYFFDKNSCRLPWFLFLLSPASCMCRPVSRQSRFSLIFFFLQQEPEPEPEPGARIRLRFRFFLGQNDTVPAVPVPAPVPQHWLRVLPIRCLFTFLQSSIRTVVNLVWLWELQVVYNCKTRQT